MFLSVIVIATCFAAQPVEKADPAASVAYMKPGAAISMAHDYQGPTQLHAIESITLRFDPIYENGSLDITPLRSDHIELLSGRISQSFDLEVEANPTIYVQFSGEKPGSFSLALDLVHTSLNGQVTRSVVSVPVQFGSLKPEKVQTKNALPEAPSRDVVRFQASETIIN